MNSNEILAQGEKAYSEERFEDALACFQQIAAENATAEAYIPYCYYCIASEISIASSNTQDSTEMVRGYQKTIALMDKAIRLALKFIRDHGNDFSNCSTSAEIITDCFTSQFHLVANGLTTAYRITQTTTTIQKTMMGDTTLWEDILGKETDQYLSLNSFDMHNMHIFTPDDKTDRVQQSKRQLIINAAQIASILEYLGREYDAHILRAAMACENADCVNGERKSLLEAHWFVCRAKEAAQSSMNKDQYQEWLSDQSSTLKRFAELEHKYGALYRGFIREGLKLNLAYYYQPQESVPKAESCASYAAAMEKKKFDAKALAKKDMWEIFLSVFAQAATIRMIPAIVFSSVISLFMGGLFHEGGAVIKIIWLIITLIIVFVRSITDSDGLTGKNFRLYRWIMIGTVLVFATNFFVGIIALIVLKVLSSKFK